MILTCVRGTFTHWGLLKTKYIATRIRINAKWGDGVDEQTKKERDNNHTQGNQGAVRHFKQLFA